VSIVANMQADKVIEILMNKSPEIRKK
jgi:hypothetical protein